MRSSPSLAARLPTGDRKSRRDPRSQNDIELSLPRVLQSSSILQAALGTPALAWTPLRPPSLPAFPRPAAPSSVVTSFTSVAVSSETTSQADQDWWDSFSSYGDYNQDVCTPGSSHGGERSGSPLQSDSPSPEAPVAGFSNPGDHDEGGAGGEYSVKCRPFALPSTPANLPRKDKIVLMIDSDGDVAVIRNRQLSKDCLFGSSIVATMQSDTFVEPAIFGEHANDDLVASSLYEQKQNLFGVSPVTALGIYDSSTDCDSITDTDDETRVLSATTSQLAEALPPKHNKNNYGADGLRLLLDSNGAVPEIMISGENGKHLLWQVTQLSAVPWQQSKTLTRLPEAPEGARITVHPVYWNNELEHSVNAWLPLDGVQASFVELQTVSLGRQESLQGVATICTPLTASTNSSGWSIKLTSLIIPDHAVSCFEQNCERDWLVFNIMWRSSTPPTADEAQAHTVVAIPVSSITQVAEEAAMTKHPFTKRFRMLLSGTGSMPIACGHGVDDWALEEFMTACWRGDGQIMFDL